MKHAAQCTVAAHGREEAQDYPVEVTIVDGKTELQLRITDHGGGLLPYGGIPPTSEEQEAIAIDAIANPSVVGPSTAERRDIFSFSLMRRQHRQDGSGAIRTLMSRREMAGSAKDRHQAARERGSDRQRGLDQTGGMDALSIEAATSSGLGATLHSSTTSTHADQTCRPATDQDLRRLLLGRPAHLHPSGRGLGRVC